MAGAARWWHWQRRHGDIGAGDNSELGGGGGITQLMNSTCLAFVRSAWHTPLLLLPLSPLPLSPAFTKRGKFVKLFPHT